MAAAPVAATPGASEALDRFLSEQESKDLLRFITCGSVDDGKSTLIGRLLYEAKLILDDQLAALEADSRRHGTQAGGLDFALLVDGLAAEREQGITIDVAYRFFQTERRKFIVADTPGHEQYTRNMATGASTADLAVVLVDARQGLTRQTRRHSLIVSLLGVRQVVLAVNKMDLVDWSEARLRQIEAEYRAFGAGLGFRDIRVIPMAALSGDNVATRSARTPWYRGPALLEHLETVVVEAPPAGRPFRMAVQHVSRPDPEFRGYAGLIADGQVAVGDPVLIQPSGRQSRVARLLVGMDEAAAAVAGQSVMLTLADAVDVARGDLLAAPAAPARVGDSLSVRLIWMAETPLRPGAGLVLKLGARTVGATVSLLGAEIDPLTLAERPIADLGMNGIATAVLTLDQPIAFDRYQDNRETGGFILIDRASNDTVGMGFVLDGHAARRTAAGVQAPAAEAPGTPRRLLPRPLEKPWRSLVKAVSWRVTGSLDTTLIAWLFTGSLHIAAAIGLTEVVTKIVLYYLHERVWNRVPLGLEKGAPSGAVTG